MVTTFIGAGGRELARVEGPRAAFELARVCGAHVRALVRDARGRRAWVQPVWP